VLCAAVAASGCGSEDGGAAGSNSDAAGATDGACAGCDGSGEGDTGADGATSADGSADDTASAGPQPPTPFAYSGKTCPALNAGKNELWSWGVTRGVDLYLPKQTQGAPLLFLWHGLGDTKENFGPAMGAQSVANALGAIVVVPQSQGKVSGWGWSTPQDAQEDASLFDDLLSCIDAQYDIDNTRVWTMGFSSGALWSSWLIMHRSSFIAAAVIWSGGTGKTANTYTKPKRQMPVLMAWGGQNDNAFFSFDETTKAMSSALQSDGHYVVLCNHGLGHTIPYQWEKWAIPFLKMHTWQTTGHSPLAEASDQQALYPNYCTFPASP
jgi:predicted esterase